MSKGISRSASIVLAYLMIKKNFTIKVKTRIEQSCCCLDSYDKYAEFIQGYHKECDFNDDCRDFI